jgi:outer membrane lipoprotein-sorting protein
MKAFLGLFFALLLVGQSYAAATPLSAKMIVANLDAAFSKINDYSCLADAHYRKGDQREDKLYRIYFKKPLLVRAEVLKGDDEGGAAVLTKDGNVKGHRGGFLAWITLTLDLDNPLVKTIRGHRMDQSNFGYMIGKMKAAVASEEIKTSGMAFIGSSETYGLEVNYKTPKDGLTKELVFVDPSTWLVKKVLGYEGSVEVINVAYSDVIVNQGLNDRLFEM